MKNPQAKTSKKMKRYRRELPDNLDTSLVDIGALNSQSETYVRPPVCDFL